MPVAAVAVRLRQLPVPVELAAAALVEIQLTEQQEQQTLVVEVAAVVTPLIRPARVDQELLSFPYLRQTTQELQLARLQLLPRGLTPLSSSRHQGVTQREPLCESL